MLYIIYQVDKPDGGAIRGAHRAAHLAYLEEHKAIVLLGGALLAEDGTTRTGSVLVINVRSRQEADRFSANEPFRRAGLFERVEISRMRRGQWNPAAVPKTPEGD